MKKILVFDMDKTIADLYGVNGWLEMLRAEDSTPYKIAKPIYDMDILNCLLNILKSVGYEVIVTTWLAKGASKKYDNEVAKVKKEWLDKYGFPYDEINAVPYGYEKSLCTKSKGGFQILFDDDANVRASWSNGMTVDANNNILEFLSQLIYEI